MYHKITDYNGGFVLKLSHIANISKQNIYHTVSASILRALQQTIFEIERLTLHIHNKYRNDEDTVNMQVFH